MTIEISGLPGRSINNTGKSNQAESAKGDTSSNQASSGSGNGSDRVSLTSSATLLKSLEDRINSLPVVDTQRVTETRHALATGSHEIDSISTADNLLTSEMALARQK